MNARNLIARVLDCIAIFNYMAAVLIAQWTLADAKPCVGEIKVEEC